MRKFFRRNFDQFQSFCSNSKVKVEFEMPDSKRRVFSLGGSFNNDKLIDSLQCLLLKGFSKLTNDLKGRLEKGEYTYKNTIESIDSIVSWLEGVIDAYKYSIDEVHRPILMNVDDARTIFDFFEENGIDLLNLDSDVKGLSKEILKYAKDSKAILGLAEIKRRKKSVFKLISSVQEYQIGNLFDQLKANGNIILKGERSDFIDIFQGIGDNKRRIEFKQKSQLLSILDYFKANKLIDSPQSRINWPYVRDNFDFEDGKEISENDRKNLSKSKNSECYDILRKIFVVKK